MQDNFENFQSKLENILKNNIPSSSQILYMGFGFIFIVLAESTPVEAEHICANIRTEIENLYISDEGKPIVTLKHIKVAYPRDGQTFSEIIGNMEHKFYSSSIGPYIENHGIVN